MKKVLFVLLAVMMVASTLVVSTSAADIPTDGLIGHFKLDGDLKNEVEGTVEGTPYAAGSAFGEALYTDVQDPDRWWLTTGVDGKAFYCADGDGFGTNVNPGDGDFTVSFWLTVPTTEDGYVPYMWYGEQSQAAGYYTSERWIGVWNVDTNNKFGAGSWACSYGPFVGSNDANGARLQVEPETSLYNTDAEGYLLQWTYITVSCKQVEGATEEDVDTYTVTLYYDGQEISTTEGMPDPYTGDPETYGDYIYFNGVNAWADKASKGAIDEVTIYNKALTADEVAALYGCYTAPADFASAADFDALLASVTEGEDTTAADTEANDTDADTTAADTEADDTAADTTAADTEEPKEGGCGSAMGAAAAIVALTSVLGCAIIKKH